MKLYWATISPPSRATLLTVRNLGLDVETTLVDISSGEHRREPFLSINPKSCVPTLVDDEFTLWESKAILIYLCQSLKKCTLMYPKCAKTRALIHQRLFNESSEFYVSVLSVTDMAYTGEPAIITPKHKASLHKSLSTLESFFDGSNDYFVGNHVTIADMAFLGSISTLIHMGYNINEFKSVAAWYERCRVLPGFDECEAGAMEYGGFLKSVLQNTFDD